jgi:hypothetical protein
MVILVSLNDSLEARMPLHIAPQEPPPSGEVHGYISDMLAQLAKMALEHRHFALAAAIGDVLSKMAPEK